MLVGVDQPRHRRHPFGVDHHIGPGFPKVRQDVRDPVPSIRMSPASGSSSRFVRIHAFLIKILFMLEIPSFCDYTKP